MKSNALAVAVVRLQVPQLHSGHHYLLHSMLAIHKNVLVFIGETEARLTPEDPLTFEMRANMLKTVYPGIRVERLRDHPSDEEWSRHLDFSIAMLDVEIGDPVHHPVLYGGRDSFLKHYTGQYRTFELPPIEPVSGTEVRDAVEPRNTEDFRAGMIYASKHKFPIAYQCVDAAITDGTKLLLGQKKRDGDKWRFIGGFVNPKDPSLERAVLREVREETGIEPTGARYLGSTLVDDYRYPKDGSDSLMSAFFHVPMMFGPAKASDDIDNLAWFPINAELKDKLIPEHLPFLAMLLFDVVLDGERID